MTKPKDDDRLKVLRRRVAKAPQEPGVYRWLSADKTVMYVGKAKNLRNRMQTYVQDGIKRSAWTEIMSRQIDDFEVTVVRSELEALILESNLIKKLKPKYNVLLKDDKGYVYARVTLQERLPRIDIVRRMENDGARYFGPFLGGKCTEQTLKMLDELLHFRSCKKSLDALNHPTPGNALTGTPCLDYQIGRCNGLCIGAITEDEYKERIQDVVRFFRGNFASVKKRAMDQMKQAASDKKFEKAARIRDVVRFIENMEEKQVVSDPSGENADVFGIALSHGKIQVMLMRQRDGKLIEQVGFALKGEAENAADALGQFLPQYYEDTQDIPDAVILREDIDDREALEGWLKLRKGTVVKILVPERGKKSKLLELAEKNAAQKVEQQFAAWEAEGRKVESALQELAVLLGLPAPPKRIEGYDISHLGGTATVGSMVVMMSGKPKREHYRSFNMQSVKEGMIDDYKSLAETLRRRLRYLKAGIREQRSSLQSRGITIGKAKKSEQQLIEEIVARHPGTLGPEHIDYRDYLLARNKADEIIAFAALFEDKAKCIEIDPVWVSDTLRGEKLGLLLVQLLLQKQKKKVYLLCKENLEEYYASIGFRTVQDAPEYLLQKVRDFVERFRQPAEIVMMIEPKKNKIDDSFVSMPDLLLIDGGKGQLSAAVEVLQSLNLTIPVAGLAKREEEIFLPGNPVSLAVPEGSQARFLLQRLRDEAHRFANDRRERRLTSSMMTSKLDEVPGIGDVLRLALLKRFGSADAAIAATDEELLKVLNASQLSALRKQFPGNVS